MRAIGWCGRALAWLVFWPLGLALSIRRGRRRRHGELIAAVQARPAPLYPYPPYPGWPQGPAPP